MLEELLANLPSTTLLAGLGATAVVCFTLGHLLAGKSARHREEVLKRDLLEAKASVPQLESNVRNRDQQILRLQEEVDELNERTTTLLQEHDEKDRAARRAERQVKNLTSELNAVRGVRIDTSSVIMDGFEDETAGDQDGSDQLSKLEALYEKLKIAVIEKDRRIEALEAELAAGSTPESAAAPVSEDGRLAEQAATITELTNTVDSLRAELAQLRSDKDMLEDLASRRSRSNRALKDATAEAEARLPTLEKQLADRDQTIASRETSIKKLLAESEQAQAEISARKDEISALATDLATRSEVLAQHERDMSALRTTLDAREQRITSLVAELAQRANDIDELREAMRAAKASAEAAGAEGSEKDRQHELAVEALHNTIKDRDFRIAALETSVEQAEGALSSARQDTDALRAELDALRQSTLDAEREQQTGRQETDRQQKAREREMEDLRASLNQHEQWLNRLKATIEDREARHSAQQSRIESLEVELEAARAELAARDTDSDASDESRHELNREIVRLSSQLDEARAELAERAQSASVYKNMLVEKDVLIANLEQELRGDAEAADAMDPEDRAALADLNAPQQIAIDWSVPAGRAQPH